MRRTATVLGLLLAAGASASDLTLERPRDLSLNVMSPLVGLVVSGVLSQDIVMVGAEYEQRLSPQWTAYAAPGLTVGTVFGRTLVGGSLGLGGRFYLSGAGFRGWWVGPDVSGTLLSGVSARLWTATLSAYGGYNVRFARNWLLSAGLGVGLRAGTLGLGPTPGLRLNLGYAF